jgi:hypothetical protein
MFDRRYREPGELPEEKEDVLTRWERMMPKPEPKPRERQLDTPP